MGERHWVIRNVVDKSILADEPGIRPIEDGPSIHRVYASRPLRDTEIGIDKSHSTVLGRASPARLKSSAGLRPSAGS